VLGAREEGVEQLLLEDRLRHHEVGAGLSLQLEAPQLALEVRGAGLHARGAHEARLAARERLAGGVDAAVEVRGHLQEADRVEVVDGGGLGVVADLRRIAGDDDEVA
jgi:hypothetical protein